MAADWTAYLPEVMLDVAGCPDSVAKNAVKQAAIEFCTESRCWTDQIDDVTTVASTGTYELAATTLQTAYGIDIEIVAVRKVQRPTAARPLPTIPSQHMDRWSPQTSTDEPRWFNSEQSFVTGATRSRFISLYPVPDDVYTYNVWATLRPKKTATSGPDFLYDDWLEPIAHGAKARLKAMSNRPWADPKMIDFHRREFIKGWTEARIRETKSNVQSSTVVAPRQFGNYRVRRI